MSLSINLALALLRPTGELLVTNYRVKKIEFEVELEIELVWLQIFWLFGYS